jgi:hypothetical protein
MSSQEELVGCLRQLTEAIAQKHSRWLSIVRDDNKRVAREQERQAQSPAEIKRKR